MVLIDTSVWIDHLRTAYAPLENLLERREILVHPFVVGELALGTMQNRGLVVASLLELPQAKVETDAAVLSLIARNNLGGSGIGYVDAHLLASALMTPAVLWTRDKRLHRVAETSGATTVQL